MKKLSFTTITCLCLMALTNLSGTPINIYRDNSNLSHFIIEFGDKIDLEGDLMGKTKGSDPIEITTTSGGISIQFNANLGDVTISIVNINGGNVYSTFINSAVQTTLFIPSQNFPSGTYNITFINNNGTASGNFNV